MTNQTAKKVQMFRRWWRIITGKSVAAVKQQRGSKWNKDKICGYYNDMTGKVSGGTLLDDNGIPLTQIHTGETVYFPIAIFQYGLGCYDLYLCNEQTMQLSDFLKIADWAYQHQQCNGAWDCFSVMRSKMYSVSAMGQSEGASVLARAYVETGEEKYKLAALAAIDFMLRDMKEGGTAMYENGALYLEEYPQMPRRSVLNGWIFSLFGLYDAILLEPGKYNMVFSQTVETLRATLSEYDNGYWSMYDLNNNIASPAYHDLHIALLEVLYELTGIQEFRTMATCFSAHKKKRINRLRAICVKLWQKLTEHTDVVTVQ